jgi:hypothetical protein
LGLGCGYFDGTWVSRPENCTLAALEPEDDVLVELAELELAEPPAALLLALLLELLLPHALTARARTPTAANVPDHALTFIRSSTFATCRRAARYGTHAGRGQATPR